MINVVATAIVIVGMTVLAFIAYSVCRFNEVMEDAEKKIEQLREELKRIEEEKEQ